MRLFRMSIVVGLFFLSMQFSAVMLFREMLKTSIEQGLPTDKYAQLQETMMQIILYSLAAAGVLFVALILAHIVQVFRMKPLPDEALMNKPSH